MRILLLHGFTGHPNDLEPLEKALVKQGFFCCRPFLPGHGTVPQDLNRIRAEDWISSVMQEKADVVIGLSMGALLAVICASQQSFQKLILISPAFFLKRLGRLSVWAAEHGLQHVLSVLPKTTGSDIQNPTGKALSQAYPAIPVPALIQFEKVRQEAIRLLPKISCPIFSFFGVHDHTVDVARSSALLHDPVIFQKSAHIIPLDFDQKELIAQCLKILEK